MLIKDVIDLAKCQLADATGLKAVTASKAFRDDQGWHVWVDLVEMSRIPTSADVLGGYEVLLADDGSLLRFDRKRTRLRAETFEENGQ